MSIQGFHKLRDPYRSLPMRVFPRPITVSWRLLTFPNLQQRANFRTANGDAIVTRAATEFRILAVVPVPYGRRSRVNLPL
jgi:hypothetical protein